MNNIIRLILTVLLGFIIYYVVVFVKPFVPLLEGRLPGVTGGDINQLTFLITSLILIIILGKGNLSAFGFKPAHIKQLIAPVLISIPAELIMMVIMIISVMLSGIMPTGEKHPGMEGGMLKTIISVIIVASICEEIFYRGLLQSLLEPLRRYGFKFVRVHISVPVIVCGVGFGLGHLCLLGSMSRVVVINIVLSSTLLGLIAGYYREKTGSLIPAVAVHMTFNIVGSAVPALLMKLSGMS
jgi:membrane protease YdiL (CAAX protease family)